MKIDVLDLAIEKGYSADPDGNVIGVRGKPLSEAVTKSGYKFFRIRVADKFFNISSHRFVAHYFGQDVIGTECVRHLDNNRSNNRPSNLKAGTRSENFQDNQQEWKRNFALAGAAPKESFLKILLEKLGRQY